MADALSSLSATGQSTAMDQLVAQYMALERRPVQTLQAQRDQLTVRSAMFTDLKSKINELKALAEEISSSDDSVFASHSVSSSDDDLATASASSSASTGSYRLESIALAKAHRVRSDQMASGWTSGAGTFVANGARIEIEAGKTLSEVRDAINSADYASGREVVATVVDNILVLESKSTGSAYAVKATDITGSILSSIGLATSSSNAVPISSAAASSTLSESYPAGNVMDGLADADHAWIGAEGQTEWTLTLDLGSSQTVSRLEWGRDRSGGATDRTPSDYTLEYWDGSAWQTLKTVADNSLTAGGTSTDTFYPVTTSQLRMTVTATNDGIAPAIDEIQFYNDAGTFSRAALQEAADATFTVNGIAVTRSSNTGLSDVVSGLSLNLKGEGGPVTIQVGEDTAGMRSKIDGFLGKLNSLMDYLRLKSAVAQDATGNYTRGALSGHTLYSGLLIYLASDMQRQVTGLPTGAPTRVADLGITMDSSLRFVLENSSTMENWLTSNPSGVAALFGGDSGIAKRMLDRLEPYVDSPSVTSKSYLDQEQASITDEQKSITDRIRQLNERLTMREQQYRTQFMKIQQMYIEAVQQQQKLQSMFSYSLSYQG